MNLSSDETVSWWRNATWTDLQAKAMSTNIDDRERAIQESRRRVEAALDAVGADTKDFARTVDRICRGLKLVDARKRGMFEAIDLRNEAVHRPGEGKARSPKDYLVGVIECQLFLREIAHKLTAMADAQSETINSTSNSRRLRLHPELAKLLERYGIDVVDEEALGDAVYAMKNVEFQGFIVGFWAIVSHPCQSEQRAQAQHLNRVLFFDQRPIHQSTAPEFKFTELRERWNNRNTQPAQPTGPETPTPRATPARPSLRLQDLDLKPVAGPSPLERILDEQIKRARGK